jgi:N-formylglutamate amidohydrolase
MDDGSGPDLLDPPFLVLEPRAQAAPVVFASPHSGNVYPQQFVRQTRLDAITLRGSEDAFIDDLFDAAPDLGMPLIKARFPRAYVDVNRGPWELDPGMFSDRLPDFVDRASPRARAGIGTIARVVSDGAEIYPGKLTFAEARRRIETLYMPYHARLDALLDAAHARWSRCLLVDCHSMPSGAAPGCVGARADFVLGDCHGSSCMAAVTDLAERSLRALGYTVSRNDPFAGGFATRHHGRPWQDRHALQVEINRGLYMHEARLEPRPYFATLAAHLAGLMAALRDLLRAEAAAENDARAAS